MSAMKKVLAAAAISAAAAGGAASVVVSPANAGVNTYPIGATCPENSQVCGTVPTRTVNARGPLVAQFTASPAHCSRIIAQTLIDGQIRGSQMLSPGQAARPVRAYVLSGNHSVGVRAIGVRGGCNTGDLMNWKGTLVVKTGADAMPFA